MEESELPAYLAARRATEDLDEGDSLRQKMLSAITARLQTGKRGGQAPALPHRWKYLGKLEENSPKRLGRQRAYDAVDELVSLIWPDGPALTSTERSRKKRSAPEAQA